MRTHRAWFVPLGWVYRPVALPGYLIVAACLVFCVQVFIAIDRHSHSVSDTMYGIFPFVVPAVIVLNWIASKTAARATASSSLDS